MVSQTNLRINEVDGIRGWAALIVVLFHAFGEMLKFAVPTVNSPWFSPLLAGNLAVLVFFVLSGDALSSTYFAGGGNKAIDRLLVRRYFRLTIPIFMSCLLTFCIMAAGLDFHAKASIILQQSDWMGQFLQFKESLFKLFQYSLIGVYVSHNRELSYNPFLWTMSVEMAGSMLVFLLCYLWKSLKSPQWTCIALVLFLAVVGSFFTLFVAGVFFGYLRQQGLFAKLLQNSKHQLVAFSLVLMIIAVITITAGKHKPLQLMLPVAILLVFCFYTQKNMRAFFCNKISHFLGDISFPLYLVHFQVLISLMSYLVVTDYAAKGVIDQAAMIKFAFISVLVSLFLAWCFRFAERRILKYVDTYVLRILSKD